MSELHLTQRELVERRERAARDRSAALQRVAGLAETQRGLGAELQRELAALQQQGADLQAMQESGADGLIAMFLRRITGRQATLARRSATDALSARYQAVSHKLRRAAAFTDELKLTAVRLHAEVQQLNDERATAERASTAAAERILDLERQITDVESGAPCAATIDDLQFELRRQTQAMQLSRAAVELLDNELPTARQLRSTVQDLHEEMQHFVLSATGIVDGAGRRIQALGTAADAPLVVAELQQSLSDLGEAMRATEIYLEHVGDLVAHQLPDLSARLRADAEARQALTDAQIHALDRTRARAEAERALRDAARREVESLSRSR